MKRTLAPKIFALLLSGLCWVYLPVLPALLVSGALFSLTLIVLTIPVLHPRSNFYVPTFSAGEASSGLVALTFDDGPDPRYTPQILDSLEREGIRAAFFLVGSRVEAYPELVREIVARGHVVGNHSYQHGLDFHFSLPKAFHEDLDAFDRAMEEVIGKRCLMFRSPQGFRTPILADVLKARRLACIGWQTRGFDSMRTDPNSILRSIVKNLSGGSILVLHDGAGLGGGSERKATLEALPRIIEEVKARGLAFERLDKLLGIQPYACRLPASLA